MHGSGIVAADCMSDAMIVSRWRSVCMTVEGLQNGILNISLCMMLVIATMLRDAAEAVGTLYAVCSPATEMQLLHEKLQSQLQQTAPPSVEQQAELEEIRQRLHNRRVKACVHYSTSPSSDSRLSSPLSSPCCMVRSFVIVLTLCRFLTSCWIILVGLFHFYLLIWCLFAAFRAMSHKANSIWPCLEASVSIFLVTTFDDLVLYVILRNPRVQLGLGTTVCRDVAPDRPVPKLQLLAQSDRARREMRTNLMQDEGDSAKNSHHGEYESTGVMMIQPTEVMYLPRRT